MSLLKKLNKDLGGLPLADAESMRQQGLKPESDKDRAAWHKQKDLALPIVGGEKGGTQHKHTDQPLHYEPSEDHLPVS